MSTYFSVCLRSSAVTFLLHEVMMQFSRQQDQQIPCHVKFCSCKKYGMYLSLISVKSNSSTVQFSLKFVFMRGYKNDKTWISGKDGALAAACTQAILSLFQLILTKYKQQDLHLSTYSRDVDLNTSEWNSSLAVTAKPWVFVCLCGCHVSASCVLDCPYSCMVSLRMCVHVGVCNFRIPNAYVRCIFLDIAGSFSSQRCDWQEPIIGLSPSGPELPIGVFKVYCHMGEEETCRHHAAAASVVCMCVCCKCAVRAPGHLPVLSVLLLCCLCVVFQCRWYRVEWSWRSSLNFRQLATVSSLQGPYTQATHSGGSLFPGNM